MRQLTILIGTLILLLGCQAQPVAEPVATTEPLPTATPVPIPTATLVPTATPAPQTATAVVAEQGNEEWTYVVLGFAGMSKGWPSLYANYMEEDLNITVKVHNDTQDGQDTKGVVAMLMARRMVQKHLAEADVVTLVAGPGEVAAAGFCMTGNGDYPLGTVPFDEYIVTFRENYDVMFDELLKHVDPATTLIRTLNYYMWHIDLLQEWGVYEECKQSWEALNDQIAESAAAHDILVVSAYEIFNGPNGDEDPVAKGYLTPDRDINELGATAVAEQFRQLGYVYASP